MPTAPEVTALLAQSAHHMAAGEAQAAVAAAQRAFEQAGALGDDRACADASHAMACVELRLLGRFAVALGAAQRAALMYRHVDDAAGECRALATQAIAASRLGYYEMAVDAALLAVKLGDAPAPGVEQVLAYHALGIAMFSGKCFVEAANAYQQAISLAQRCVPPLNTFELHSDLASTEAFRYLIERSAGGERLSLDMLEIHVQRGEAMLAMPGGAPSIAPASHTNNLMVLALTRLHLLIWRGRLAEAGAALRAYEEQVQALQRPWLGAAAHWAAAELALAAGDSAQAQSRASDMVALAQKHHHEGLLAVGLHLQGHICQLRGDLAGALQALQRLAHREQAARAQSLKGRLDAIERQLEMRRQTRQLARLEDDSRLFRRLAMEDGLTGLANRRRFDAELALALQRAAEPGAAPACLAMIDIDRFKQINDTHSHNVGDEVLRRIAALLRQHTREHDLPARLAGDEFVVLLHEAPLARAAQVCTRLQQAVADYGWAEVSPGLQVTLSVGLSALQPGDTVAALTLRADERMYADKRRTAHGA